MQESIAQNGGLVRFSDFAEEPAALEGDKVPIDSILNKELIVNGFRIGKTKYCHGGSNQCLTLEVVIDGLKHVVFSGSGVLIEQMTKYGENIPFIATIVKINKYYRLK